MKTSQDLIARLRSAGGKLTPQRLFLFRALEHAHSHPSAEDLYDKVRVDLPSLSLGTVYKTLAELVDLGEVQTVETGDGRTHYDPNMEPHAHLHCRRCGRLADVSLDVVNVEAPVEVDGFVITGQRLVLEGYCRTCR
ncbi:MAG TPA: Fur family transcriptional regulator [Chloroflexota bacterium]|nr:Fur family transcriptional regulator [Chloroflexota bacterium]